jgi:uncharacterized protein (DUF952 family)
MSIAWKILTGPQMAALLDKGSFAGAPVDLADGYIHLSTQDQLAGTLAKWFAGQDGLHLAAVDLDALGDCVTWEEARGGALFPHIYADLPLSAVLVHAPLAWAADGVPDLPALP